MFRKPRFPQYASHVSYGGHNAIPLHSFTILLEVDLFAPPLLAEQAGHS